LKQVALITGASSGIGAELAKIHASRGGDLVLVARRRRRLEDLAAELKSRHGTKAMILIQDLGDPDCAEVMFKACEHGNVEVDYLVNNAGFGGHGFFHESDASSLDEMVRVNVLALTNLTRVFLPEMVKRRRGWVMNVASTAAFVPGPLQAVYYATKAYVLSFSQAVANELKDSGIQVSVLCPGPTETEFFEVADLMNTKLTKLATAPVESCAEYGYRAMLKGKRVAVHGLTNKLLVTGIRFSPRSMATEIARRLQEKN
jgi:hypothetical protein